MITLELQAQHLLASDIAHFTFLAHQEVKRKAGQYAMVVTSTGDARALSIASAPHEKTIEFITHLSPSAFKQSLKRLQPGETVEMTEPTGDFLWPDHQENPLLIAGGVGISPFRSMWRDRAYRNLSLQAALFYYAAEDCFLFTNELAQLSTSHPEFSVQRIPHSLKEQGNIKEVETRSDRLILMSGVYSQGKPHEFSQPSFQQALEREEAAFVDVTRKLIP